LFIVCLVSYLGLTGSHILERGKFLGKGVYELKKPGYILKKAGAFKEKMDTKYKNKIYFSIFSLNVQTCLSRVDELKEVSY
jgi:hypothetical protein